MKGFRWCPHCGSPHSLDVQTCPDLGEALPTPTTVEVGSNTEGLLVDARYRIGKRLGKGPSGSDVPLC